MLSLVLISVILSVLVSVSCASRQSSPLSLSGSACAQTARRSAGYGQMRASWSKRPRRRAATVPASRSWTRAHQTPASSSPPSACSSRSARALRRALLMSPPSAGARRPPRASLSASTASWCSRNGATRPSGVRESAAETLMRPKTSKASPYRLSRSSVSASRRAKARRPAAGSVSAAPRRHAARAADSGLTPPPVAAPRTCSSSARASNVLLLYTTDIYTCPSIFVYSV